FLNLQAESLDPAPVPVAGASVTLFVGAVAVYNGASDSLGWVSPQNILLRDIASYNIKAYWQGSLVNQTTNYNPTSSLTIPLHPKEARNRDNLQLNLLTVVAVDARGQAVSGATVALTLSSQTIAQKTSGSTGVLLVHALPKGQYVLQLTSQSPSIRNTLHLS